MKRPTKHIRVNKDLLSKLRRLMPEPEFRTDGERIDFMFKTSLFAIEDKIIGGNHHRKRKKR